MTWPPDPNVPTEPHVRAFFDDIADHPNDATVRLVFADWLAERDDPRAELLRLQAQYLHARASARRPLETRLKDWAAQYGGAWLGQVDATLVRPENPKLELWGYAADEFLRGAAWQFHRQALREGWAHMLALHHWSDDQVLEAGRLALFGGPHDLSIVNCNLRDSTLAAIRDLPRLRHFLVMGEEVPLGNGILPHVGTLTGLQELDLCDLQHLTGTGLAHLASLGRLRWLHVTHCPQLADAGVATLPYLPHLEKLLLGRAPELTGTGLRSLAGLPALRDLSLTECDQLTDVGLAHLAPLVGLRRLDLDGCEAITDAGLQHLANLTALTELGLSCCTQVNGAGLAHLRGLKKLKQLRLTGVPLKAHALRALRTALPKCKVIRET